MNEREVWVRAVPWCLGTVAVAIAILLLCLTIIAARVRQLIG